MTVTLTMGQEHVYSVRFFTKIRRTLVAEPVLTADSKSALHMRMWVVITIPCS